MVCVFEDFHHVNRQVCQTCFIVSESSGFNQSCLKVKNKRQIEGSTESVLTETMRTETKTSKIKQKDFEDANAQVKLSKKKQKVQ